MRVRDVAVVGAAMVAAWAGGIGVAQATGGSDGDVCDELLSVATVEGPLPGGDPCELPPIDVCIFLPPVTEDATADGRPEEIAPIDTCSVDVALAVLGDCEDPETFVFTVDATGLEPNTEYTVFLTSADLATIGEGDVPPYVEFDFTSDADGDVENATHTATEGDFDFPAGEFTLTYVVVPADVDSGEFALPYVDYVVVSGECTVTQPGGTTPTTTTSAPTSTAPVTAAPVVVTHPAAAQPAVLANTGAPVTAAALLGGGLVVAGAAALVATRRRTS